MAEQKYVCPNCSGLIDYGTRFCPHCGNALGNWGNAYSSAPVNNNAAVVKEESFFEKYFSTKGRLNRKAAILRNLFISMVGSVFIFILGLISAGYSKYIKSRFWYIEIIVRILCEKNLVH